MLTVCSYQGRTIVSRLDQGEDLMEGLRRLCAEQQIRGGVITAIGALEYAEVAHYLPARKAYGLTRTFTGPLELLSLTGNLSESDGELSIRLNATLSREGDNGVEMLGGRLLSGRAIFCELSILALDDVLLRRAQDHELGIRLWHQGFEQDANGMGRVVESRPHAPGDSRDPPPPSPSEVIAATGAGVPDEPIGETTPKARRGAAARAVATGGPSTVSPPTEPKAPLAKGSTSPDEPGQPTQARAQELSPTRASTSAWEEVANASAAAHREPAELPVRPDREARAGDEEHAPVEDDDEDIGDDVDLEPGDIVEHPKFGRCRVERVEGVDEYVHVRLRNRNLVRLSLDVITLELIGSESGHQVFRARIG